MATAAHWKNKMFDWSRECSLEVERPKRLSPPEEDPRGPLMKAKPQNAPRTLQKGLASRNVAEAAGNAKGPEVALQQSGKQSKKSKAPSAKNNPAATGKGKFQDEDTKTMPATAVKTAPLSIASAQAVSTARMRAAATSATATRTTATPRATVASSRASLASRATLATAARGANAGKNVTGRKQGLEGRAVLTAAASANSSISFEAGASFEVSAAVSSASLAVMQQTIVLNSNSMTAGNAGVASEESAQPKAHSRSKRGAENAEERRARRDAIILEHLNLVKAIAVRVHENLPVHLDMDDLVHAGILGLFDAAEKFDSDKMVSFSSYAKHRIKGAILDSLRQLDWASRDLRRRHKQLEALTRELTVELHRAPTEEELANRMGVPVERWREMMVDLRNVGLISASSRGNDGEDLPAPDFPSSPDLQPDRICQQEQLKGMLGIAMKTLPERYQKVVLLYYSNELTMKEIGNMLGINESRVSQIHKSALEKMASAMREAGIESPAAF